MNTVLTELTEEKAKKLLDAGVHFGQPQSKRSPKMNEFVCGVARNGLQIIDLDKLWQQLQIAGQAIKKLAQENKNIQNT